MTREGQRAYIKLSRTHGKAKAMRFLKKAIEDGVSGSDKWIVESEKEGNNKYSEALLGVL